MQSNILHENLMIFSILFDAVLEGYILHENLMIFSIPFDAVL
jgi:energy-converting hydrogenase Eha subunit F